MNARRASHERDERRFNHCAVGAGWFVTPVLLMKAEYVHQKFFVYPPTHIRNGGKFNGFIAEGVIAF